MENNAWEFLSPTNFTFRAYGVKDKRELILKAVEDALEQFKYCDAVQIDITAPGKRTHRHSMLWREKEQHAFRKHSREGIRRIKEYSRLTVIP